MTLSVPRPQHGHLSCVGLTSGIGKSGIQLDSLQEKLVGTRILKEKKAALNHSLDSRAPCQT